MGERDSFLKEEFIASINQPNAQSAETVKPSDRYSEMVARYENDAIQEIIQKLAQEKNKTGGVLSNSERAQLNDALLEGYAAANRIGQETVESIDGLFAGKLKEAILQNLPKKRQKRYKESSVGEMFGRRDLRKSVLDALRDTVDLYKFSPQDTTALNVSESEREIWGTVISKARDVDRIVEYLDDRMGILVQANTRLIFHYLKKSGLQEKIPSNIYDDIMQEGKDGLCEAINTFDKNKGAFTTRAKPCIEETILRALPENLRSIRIPAEKRATVKSIEKIYQQLVFYRQSGDQPTITPEDISAILQETLGQSSASPTNMILNGEQKQHFSAWLERTFTPKQLETIKTFDVAAIRQGLLDARTNRAHVSLNAPFNPHDPTSGTREEFLVDSSQTGNPEQTAIDAVSKAELREKLKKILSPKELFVFERRYGLYDGNEYPPAEIARQLGVSRQRVDQLFKAAMPKLQEHQAFFKDFLL